MPSFHDPFGEFDDMRPAPLEEAVRDLQIAEEGFFHLCTAISLKEKEMRSLQEKKAEAEKLKKRMSYQLLLSARHHFIPPTS